MSQLVNSVLTRMGLRIVCTSRPEGVDLNAFKNSCMILSLKELDADQARQAVEQQMGEVQQGREFAEHLLSFSKIRT